MGKLQDEIILAYRRVIDNRYQFDHLNSKYELTNSFDESRINKFKNFFLDYVYPPPMKRKELDDAFSNLDSFIQNPEKLLNILLESVKLIFKYGRHLPKILKAGLGALKSYRQANKFENRLMQASEKKNLTPPFSESDIVQLIRSIPKNEIDSFIESSKTLFETLHDRKLVQKILDIVNHLILNMKAKPSIYSPSEIKGLEIGQELIANGNQLFDQLIPSEQIQLFDFVLEIEETALKEIYDSE